MSSSPSPDSPPPRSSSSSASASQDSDESSSSSPSPPSSDSSSSSSDQSSSSSSSPSSDKSASSDNKSSSDDNSPPSDRKSDGKSHALPYESAALNGNSWQKSLPWNSSQSSSKDHQKAVIAGVAAALGLLILIIIVVWVCCARRKKRKPRDHMNYYRDDSRGRGNTKNEYYNSVPQGNWQNNGRTATNSMMKLPVPPNSGAVSSEYGWMPAPPPPPPMMSSSEMSSAGFSGPHHALPPPPHPGVALGFNQNSFTYNDLATATSGFLQSNLLGQGGFGYVHKGVLPNGKEIAVKSLKLNSGQGEREFQAEVDIISRVHHRYLVSLVGYCIAGSQRMLVYEYVPNGTLEYHLHAPGRPTMDWPTRLKIALGSAKGFAYLHEDCHPRIIHRDIKAANILLDYNFDAKVADFGLAKLSSDNNTHVSTRIMGTFGYLAPEYASSGKLTEKSDVYSYGIMLLELITGRRPIDVSRDDDDDTLVDWARPILNGVADGGSYEELVDPRLGANYDLQEMLRMVCCAAACIRQSARRRPKMSQIVRALEGDVSLEDLIDGVKPGHSSILGSGSSSDLDLKRFRKVLSSQEFSSSENSQEIARSTPGSHTHTP